MRAAFDAKAAGEEKLGFYDKMEKAHARAQSGGYRFVVAFVADEHQKNYSVAFVSRAPDDERAFADLDNFSWTMEHTKPLAVLDTQSPFEALLKRGVEAEHYIKKPAIFIPDAAKAYPDSKKLFVDKVRRAAFRVIEGGKPDSLDMG